MLRSLRFLGIAVAVTAIGIGAGPAAAGDAYLFQSPARFKVKTGATRLAFPLDAATALPDLPFDPSLVGYSCTAAVPGIDLPFASLDPTANVAAPAAPYLCFLGPDWNAGLSNIDPTPETPTIVADGEDDFELSFDPPVYAVGLSLLTNADADEALTVHYEDGSSETFDDDALGTDPNDNEFVGVKSIDPIVGVSLDTTGGAVQNEGIGGVRTADFFGVRIDVRPGNSRNPVNCKSRGKIPVAIFGERGFDPVADLDPSTLTFGGTGLEDSLVSCNTDEDIDLNGDHRRDLVCRFYTEAADFCGGPDTCRAKLAGETWDGVPIRGSDWIWIVPGSNHPSGDDGNGNGHGNGHGKGKNGVPPGLAKKGG